MKYVWVDIKENYFMNIKILIPVYNDWKSTFRLLDEINNLDLNKEFKVSIIIINDASNHDLLDYKKNLENIDSIKILLLKKRILIMLFQWMGTERIDQRKLKIF